MRPSRPPHRAGKISGTGVLKRVVLPVVIVVLVLAMAYAASPFAPMVGAWAYDQLAPSAGPPEKVPTADVNGDGPGAVLQASTLPLVMRKWEGHGLEAARVVYRSTSGD